MAGSFAVMTTLGPFRVVSRFGGGRGGRGGHGGGLLGAISRETSVWESRRRGSMERMRRGLTASGGRTGQGLRGPRVSGPRSLWGRRGNRILRIANRGRGNRGAGCCRFRSRGRRGNRILRIARRGRRSLGTRGCRFRSRRLVWGRRSDRVLLTGGCDWCLTAGGCGRGRLLDGGSRSRRARPGQRSGCRRPCTGLQGMGDRRSRPGQRPGCRRPCTGLEGMGDRRPRPGQRPGCRSLCTGLEWMGDGRSRPGQRLGCRRTRMTRPGSMHSGNLGACPRGEGGLVQRQVGHRSQALHGLQVGVAPGGDRSVSLFGLVGPSRTLLFSQLRLLFVELALGLVQIALGLLNLAANFVVIGSLRGLPLVHGPVRFLRVVPRVSGKSTQGRVLGGSR